MWRVGPEEVADPDPDPEWSRATMELINSGGCKRVRLWSQGEDQEDDQDDQGEEDVGQMNDDEDETQGAQGAQVGQRPSKRHRSRSPTPNPQELRPPPPTEISETVSFASPKGPTGPMVGGRGSGQDDPANSPGPKGPCEGPEEDQQVVPTQAPGLDPDTVCSTSEVCAPDPADT